MGLEKISLLLTNTQQSPLQFCHLHISLAFALGFSLGNQMQVLA